MLPGEKMGRENQLCCHSSYTPGAAQLDILNDQGRNRRQVEGGDVFLRLEPGRRSKTGKAFNFRWRSSTNHARTTGKNVQETAGKGWKWNPAHRKAMPGYDSQCSARPFPSADGTTRLLDEPEWRIPVPTRPHSEDAPANWWTERSSDPICATHFAGTARVSGLTYVINLDRHVQAATSYRTTLERRRQHHTSSGGI